MQLSKSFVCSLPILCIFCLSLFFAPITIAQESNPKSVYQIAISGDQRVLGVTYGSYEYRSIVDLFDSATGQLLNTVDLSPSIMRRIALSPSGDQIAHSGSSGDFGVFDISEGRDIISYGGGAVTIGDVIWNPINDQVAYALGSAVNVLDSITRTQMYAIGAGSGLVSDIKWSLDGKWLATITYTAAIFDSPEKWRVKIWDLSSAIENSLTIPYATFEDRDGFSADWSPDSKKLAMIESYQLLIYDIEAQQIEVEVPVDGELFGQIEWNPTGDKLATGGTVIRIWDTDTWEVIETISPEWSAVNLQWSLDGEHLFHDGGSDGLYVDGTPVTEFSATPEA